MYDVFISYKKEDVARVEPIARALAHAGYEVWWDHRIPPGRTYRDVIGAALEQAKCVIVVWSNLSVAAQWVLDEADEGKRRNVLLPLQIDDVALPYGFRQLEAARLTGWDGDTSNSEWLGVLGSVAHMTGRPAGDPPKPFVTPSALKVSATPPHTKPSRGARIPIVALVAAVILIGAGYFAWRSGAFEQQIAASDETAIVEEAPEPAASLDVEAARAERPSVQPPREPVREAAATASPPSSLPRFSLQRSEVRSVLNGIWAGHHDCGQPVPIRVDLAVDESGRVSGLRSFQSGQNFGAFEIDGRFDQDSGAILLNAGRWIRQPEGFSACNLRGALTPTLDAITGDAPGCACGAFTLTRER